MSAAGDAVGRQFVRAWERLRVNAPTRCNQLFINNWFEHLAMQGVVVGWNIEPSPPHGYEVWWTCDGSNWDTYLAETP